MKFQRYAKLELNDNLSLENKQQFISNTRNFMINHKMLPMNDRTYISKDRISEIKVAQISYDFASQHPEIVKNLNAFKWISQYKQQETNYLNLLKEHVISPEINLTNVKTRSRGR